MAHEIWENDNFLTVRKPAWHGLGMVLDDYPTRVEAQQLAHPWEPITEPVYLQDIQVGTKEKYTYGGASITMDAGSEVPEAFGEPEQVPDVRTTFNQAEGFKAVRRSDDGSLLGIVGDGYEPVSNNEMWDIAEALQGEAKNGIKFETAGSLQGGRKVWLLVTLDEPLTVEGDPNGATVPYYSLQNAHDGSGAFRGQATMTRIVCANTAHIADLDARARGTEFTFRHTKNVGERIDEAREALHGWRESLAIWKQLSEHMLTLKVDGFGEIHEFLERWIPMPPAGTSTDRVRDNVEAARSQWLEAWSSETTEDIGLTAHGILQASIEYAEWYRRAQSTESRFKRSFLDRNQIVQSAQKLVLEIAR